MDEKAKKQRLGEAYARIVDLIGEANVKKLVDNGFQVVIGLDFQHFVLAHSKESERLRDLLAASERDRERTSARVQLIVADDQLAALVTSATADEVHLGKCLAEALAPIVKDLVTVRFAAQRPEPILPPMNAKGGSA